MPSTKRGNSWLITVPVTIAAIAYVSLMFLPNKRAIDRLREEIRSKQEYLAEANGLSNQVASREQELAKTREYVASRQKYLPQESDLPALYARIHEAAQAAHARVTRFDPQPAVPYERLRRIPVTLTCSGSYQHMVELLRGLEGMPSAVWMEVVKIDKVGDSAKDVNCELSLVVFSGSSENSDYAKGAE
jgi:Tfp pilus assembly protein PilO